jgi:hypothetical protein
LGNIFRDCFCHIKAGRNNNKKRKERKEREKKREEREREKRREEREKREREERERREREKRKKSGFGAACHLFDIRSEGLIKMGVVLNA